MWRRRSILAAIQGSSRRRRKPTTRVGGEAATSSELEVFNYHDNISVSFGRLRRLFSASSVNNELYNHLAVDEEQLERALSLLLLTQSSLESSLNEHLNNHNDIFANDEFVLKVLQTPLVPPANLIAFFNFYRAHKSSPPPASSLEALVLSVVSHSASACKTDAYALWDLIKDIAIPIPEHKDACPSLTVTTLVLNHLISLFSKLGKAKAAFQVFSKFDHFRCVPDADTYYYTLEALCRRSFFDWASSVSHQMIASGKLPDRGRVGKLISYFCKGDKPMEAHSLYLLAKDTFPPPSSVNFLIRCLSRGDDTVPLAVGMLDYFSGEEQRRLAIKPFSSVIHGLCRTRDVAGAKDLLLKMIEAGPPPGNGVFNFVINAFSKVGDMEEAKNVMKLMESRGLKPDVYTYSVIMSGYVNGGEMEEARKVLGEAKERHSKLTPVTYHTLIRGYCKLGQYDKAVELLGEMKEFGVEPNADEYNKLIQSLCLKALDWKTAEKLLEEMKEKSLHLNGSTKALLRALKEVEQEEEEEAGDDYREKEGTVAV